MEIGVGEAKNVIKERDKRKRKKVLRKRMLQNTLTLGFKLELSLPFFVNKCVSNVIHYITSSC